jgi:hypothetical protein
MFWSANFSHRLRSKHCPYPPILLIKTHIIGQNVQLDISPLLRDHAQVHALCQFCNPTSHWLPHFGLWLWKGPLLRQYIHKNLGNQPQRQVERRASNTCDVSIYSWDHLFLGFGMHVGSTSKELHRVDNESNSKNYLNTDVIASTLSNKSESGQRTGCQAGTPPWTTPRSSIGRSQTRWCEWRRFLARKRFNGVPSYSLHGLVFDQQLLARLPSRFHRSILVSSPPLDWRQDTSYPHYYQSLQKWLPQQLSL